MKIGILIDQLVLGGVQKTALMEAKTLQEKGHQVIILVLMRHNYINQYVDLTKNLKIRFLSDDYPWVLRHSFKFPIFSFLSTLHLLSPTLAPRVIRPKQFDLIISHGTTTCFTAQSLWQKQGIPYVAVVHDPMIYIFDKIYARTPLRFLFPILAPIIIAKERAFILNSLYTAVDSPVHKDYLKGVYHVIPEVIPLGCEPLKQLPKKLGPSLLALSRWEKSKNPEFLLRLLEKIKGARLIIAGSWLNEEDKENFKTRVIEKKLEKRVEIIDHFEEKDLKNLCQRSRLWIHPHFEAFGMGGLEAAAHGLPLIIPQGSGITSFFQDGVDGFFPKKITISEYQKYVKHLLDNEKLAREMGHHAWQEVKKQYSWQTHIQKLISIAQKRLPELSVPQITAIEIGHAGETGLSGGDRLFEEIVKRMPKKFRIEVITSPFGSIHWREAEVSIKLQTLRRNPFEKNPGPIDVFLSYLIRILQASFYLIRKRQKLEILYSSTNILPDVLPAFIARLVNPKITWIARVHHLVPPPHQRKGRLAVNIVSYLMQTLALFCMRKKADLTIALNQTLYQHLTKHGFSENKLSVIGAGIDFKQITEYQPRKTEAFAGVYLGRLHVSKGIFDTVDIWREVVKEKKKAKLAIIGTGPESIKKELEKKVKKGKLTQNIKILGYLPEEKVYDYLKSAKVFLFTDHEAGWGLAVAEAMACGLPVVAYNLDVFQTVFYQGFITVPIGNTQKAGQAVSHLLKDNKKRKALSQKAFEQAKTLDWNKSVQQLVVHLENLIEKQD